jgi:2'-5' RNA ligase
VRLFLAFNLPSTERNRLWRATSALRDADIPVRWTAEESLHVTVKFLGEVAGAKLIEVENAVRRAARQSAPFELRVHGLGGFPNLKRPRVVWVGVDAHEAITRAHENVEQALSPLGFEREDRDFHPHVTLGRASGGTTASGFASLQELARDFNCDARVTVATLDLMRSHLGRGGARYECILAAPLVG